MSGFTCEDLKKARELRNFTQLDVAIAVNVSESTVRRWENGESEPGHNDIARIEKFLQKPGFWRGYMRTRSIKYPEYYGEIEECDNLSAALTQARCELNDVIEGIGVVERDAIDGRIDDLNAKTKLQKELQDAGAAFQQVQDWLTYDENAHRVEPVSVRQERVLRNNTL